jgi:hypothetical protein
MPNPPLRAPNLRRATVTALVLLAALLLAPGEGSRLVSLSGDVEIGRGEPPVFASARAGEPLAPGEMVRTGDDGRAELDLGRASVRLYPNSLLRIPESAGAMSSDGEARGVLLERGRSLFEVLRGSDPFEVRTPDVVVSVKGTRFSVALADAQAAVAVFRGLVGVRSLAAEAAFETLVREGFVARGQQSFELSLHETADPWEAWQGGPELPQLPEPALDGAASGKQAALLEARAAALASARPEAVLRAAERHPEVADELARARAKGDEATGGAAAKLDVDAVQDGERDRMQQMLEQSYVEEYLAANMDPGGSGAVSLALTLVDDLVHVDASNGSSWDLDEDVLEDVLEGEGSLPANLVALLGDQGIAQEDFAQNLLMLLD